MGRLRLLTFLTFILACCYSSYGFAGAGVHWGFDFSLDMDDVYNEQAFYPGFSDSAEEYLFEIMGDREIAGFSIEAFLDSLEGTPLRNGLLPVTISRTDWNRSVFNFGAKVFFDKIPIIDAIQLSLNFGLWEYEGLLHYPTGPDDDIDDAALRERVMEDPASVTYRDFLVYDTLPITLEEFDMSYFGLSKTPFVKLQFDLSVRKDLYRFPKRMKIVRLYAGGGLSMIFNTPALTSELVEEVMGETLTDNIDNLSTFLTGASGEELQERVLNKMIRDFQSPTFGINLLVGTAVKFPVIPLGVYGDIKYTIPFSDLEEAAGIRGNGFLINLGLALTL